MKKQSLKAFSKLFFLLLTATTLGAFSAAAQTGDDNQGKGPIVKYLGTAQNRNIFQVQLDNEAGDKFSLMIKDHYGNLLFQESYKEKRFDKKFLLDKAESEPRLLFVIRNGKNNEQVFEVNKETRVIEDVVVTKL